MLCLAIKILLQVVSLFIPLLCCKYYTDTIIYTGLFLYPIQLVAFDLEECLVFDRETYCLSGSSAYANYLSEKGIDVQYGDKFAFKAEHIQPIFSI